MIKRLLLIAVIMLSLSLPTSVLAAEPGEGKIEGQLVNGTEGGSSVAGQEITLKTSRNDAEIGSAIAKSDVEGKFVFEGLVTDTDYSYQVTLTYQEAEYTSEPFTFGQGEATKVTQITVYDATDSDEAISVDTAHTIIYVEPGGLRIMEYYLFVNDSTRAYVGSGEITATGKRKTLIGFALPSKAAEVQYGGDLMECCILRSGEGLTDTMPVLPGSKEIIYAYRVNYGSEAYTFSREMSYPVANYDFLVQGEGIKASSEQLAAGEPINIENTLFNRLYGANFLPGKTIKVQLSGLPKVGSQKTLIIWVVLTLVVLGGGFVLNSWLGKRRLQPVRAGGGLDRGREGLLVELAQLDDDFEAGKIHEEVYRRLRAEKKSQLVALMRGSREKRGRR